MTPTNITGLHFILYNYFLYDDSLSDILINYCLIIVFTLINNCGPQDVGRTLANLHTVIFCLLQTLCWLLLEAYGVSLVWSGQLGLSLLLVLDWSGLCSLADSQARNNQGTSSPTKLGLRAASGLVGVVAILYYAVWFPPITTVAHLVSVLAGSLVGLTLIVLTSIRRLGRLSKLDE